MAAPNGTVWGSIVNGSSSGRKGRLGIYTSVSNTNDKTTVNVQVWFWTIYSCADSGNTFYYNVGTNVTSASSVKSSNHDIDHTVATGETWNTANQTRLLNETYTYNRGTSAVTYKVYAKFSNIDMLNSSALANTSYTVPELASYTVSYHANGGGGAPSSQKKWYGKTLTISTTKPTRTGYSFQGWALSKANADAGTWYYQPGSECGRNENLTLYAVWKANTYTVSYNANGGDGAPGDQTKTHDVNLTLSSAKPTRTGHTFQGWATSATGGVIYTSGAVYTGNTNTTLYAVWKADTYTIGYDANGGTGGPVNQTKTYGVNLTLSDARPTKQNYNFIGWSTSASATTKQYDPGGLYTSNSAATLYAVWELAYVRPRIQNVMVSRCDSDGNALDTGTHALVRFDWECDRDVSSISIEWESANGTTGTASPTATKTNGTVSEVVGGSFGVDSTYSFTITVTDTNGYSVAFATMQGTRYAIDFLAGGNGIALNKPAELPGVFDVDFQTYLRGGLKYVVLDEDMDLNGLLTPGFYVGSHIWTYTNCPIPVGCSFTLEIMSSGDIGQVIQRLTNCDMNHPVVYERAYYELYWGEWVQKTPTHIWESILHTPSAANTFELVGSITIPKFKVFTITARGIWNNAQCGGVVISTSNTDYRHSLAAQFNDNQAIYYPSCTFSGNTGNGPWTLYFWAKWVDTTSNSIEVTGFHMPY